MPMQQDYCTKQDKIDLKIFFIQLSVFFMEIVLFIKKKGQGFFFLHSAWRTCFHPVANPLQANKLSVCIKKNNKKQNLM